MSTTPISPKVTAGGASGAITGLLLSYAAAVQPDMFAFLGKWQGFAFLLFSLAVSVGAAWWKKDPLRVAVNPDPDGSYNITGLPTATAPDLATAIAEFKAALTASAPAPAPSSFAPTQAKVDAVTPVYDPPAAPAAE